MEKENENTFIIKIGSSMHLMKSIKEIKLPDEYSHSSGYMKNTISLTDSDEFKQYKRLVKWDIDRAIECFNLIKESKEMYTKGYMIIPLYSPYSIDKIKEKGFTVERYGWAVDHENENLYKISWLVEDKNEEQV